MRLERFLLLGSQDGTWSVARRTLQPEQATAASACLREDGLRAVETVVRFVATRNAPSRQPALLVLAMAASPAYAGTRTNAAALAALPEVAVTGTHLLHFVRFAETQRGWGRGLRSAVADWYLRKPAAELARHFAVRSHRDLLRNAHPKPITAAQNALFQWAVEGRFGHLATPELLAGDLRLIHASSRSAPPPAKTKWSASSKITVCRITWFRPSGRPPHACGKPCYTRSPTAPW
jgi:60 kDa SS-A/Ro ribonucleoprotein